jgi:hypothetical protein
MLHSEKPLPPAITHNDEIARLILVELRGMRDDMAAARAALDAAAQDAAQQATRSKTPARLPVELREPGIGLIDALNGAPMRLDPPPQPVKLTAPPTPAPEPGKPVSRKKAGA